MYVKQVLPYLGCFCLKRLLFDAGLQLVSPRRPQYLHPVLDIADLIQQGGDGCQGAGEVGVAGQVRRGCGGHVLINSGSLTCQVLNMQHLQSLPPDEAMSVQVLLGLLDGGWFLLLCSEGLNYTGKTLGDGDAVT